MIEQCHRCGKYLPNQATIPPGLGWHWITVPHGPSDGTMIAVCDKCDPPPVLVPPAEYKALKTAATEFVNDLTNGICRTNKCECKSCKRKRGIFAALRAVGFKSEE